MANLEMDKEEMKKKMMAEVKLDMIKEKRRLKGFLGAEVTEEDDGREQLLGAGARSATHGIGI